MASEFNGDHLFLFEDEINVSAMIFAAVCFEISSYNRYGSVKEFLLDLKRIYY